MKSLVNAFFFLLCLAILPGTYAQNGPAAPASPTAAAIAKSVNYPVNLNSGVPDISIPLGKIQAGGNLVLPVELSYHAGGFKINERSGVVGLGWSISTDLQISRSINGISDFGNFGYINNTDILPYDNTANGAFTYTREKCFRLANGEKDALPDKFTYKLLNKSGSFFFQKEASGYSIVPVPYDNIKIEFSNNQFRITDTDGTIYYYGKEATGWTEDQIDQLGYELTIGDISTWKCTKIVDATANNIIEFTYSKKTVESLVTTDDKIEYYQNDNPCSMTQWTGESIYQWNNTYQNPIPTTYTGLLSAVSDNFYRLACPKYMEYFNGKPKTFNMLIRNESSGAIEKQQFTYDGPGGSLYEIKGLALSSITFRGGQVQFVGIDNLSSILFKDAGGNTVRSVAFTQSYISRPYNDTHRTYYLDEVSITGSNTSFSPEKYAMLYRNKAYFGSYLKGHDAWGYRNAHTVDAEYAAMMGMPGLTPYNQVAQDYYSASYGGCNPPVPAVNFEVGNLDVNEYPDERYMNYGMLKRIIYPSGGFVDFDFEANRYHHIVGLNFKPLLYTGGLRIQKITYYDGISSITKPAKQKYYVYGTLETGEGEAANKPELKFGYGVMYYGTHKYSQRVIYANAPNSYFAGPGREFTYITIPCTNFNCITIKAIENKTTFLPNSALDLSYANGSPVYYTKVTEYQQDYGDHTGKTVTEFYPYGAFGGENLPVIPQPAVIPGTNVRYINVSWHVGALKSVTNYLYANGTYTLQSQKEYEYTKYKLPVMPRAVYCFLKTIWQFSSTLYNFYTEAVFNPGPYSYLSDVNQDYTAGQYGIPVGRLLLSKETDTYKDKTTGLLLTNANDYYYDRLPYIQPSRIVTTDSKQQTFTKHLSYSYDFPSEAVYNHMVTKNIIQPVVIEAVVKGANTELSKVKTNYDFVSGQSFVSPASIQKSLEGAAFETEMTFTRYDQYGNLLEAVGRDGNVKSCLYGYNARYPVALLQKVNYQSIPASILSSPELANPSSDASLRSLLTPLYALGNNSMVTTYTYKPFIGMTSMTDVNQRNTYYDYDLAGRLSVVRDHDNNVIRKHELSYKTPDEIAYTIFWTNKPVMGTYNNAHCSPYYSDGPGGPHPPRNYIVPGGSMVWVAWPEPPADVSVDEHTNYGTSCWFPSSDYATIRLNTFLFLTIPDAVFVDFLQDDHVIATFKFMYTPANDQFRFIYLPQGNYKVSFRPSGNYKGDLLKYRFYKEGTNYWVETGSTLSLTNGGNYELEVVNISGANYPFIP